MGAVWLGWGAPELRAGGGLVVQGCRQEVIEGEVTRGTSFHKAIGAGLVVWLDADEAGWALRVLPERGPRPAMDYAELATPPYRSINPLLIGTDFGFRAQDAVGWNPRRFRFATGRTMHRQMESAFRMTESEVGGPAETELARLVAEAPEGRLDVVDARLIPGLADQSKAASLVATHLTATAHTTEAPSVGASMPLGRLLWLRFRVRLSIPAGFSAAAGIKMEPVPCQPPRN